MYMKKALSFFLFSNIFIAIGAAITMYATILLFALPLSVVHAYFMCTATLSAYCMHWYFTTSALHTSSREAWSIANKKILAAFFIMAFITSVYLASYFSAMQLLYYVPLVLATLIYTAPKLPYKVFATMRTKVAAKTLYLTLAWTYATSILPILLTGASWQNAYSSFCWHRFYLIFAICLLFDYRDKEVDMLSGIKSILKFATTGLIKTMLQILITLSIISNLNLINNISTAYFVINFIPLFVLMLTYQKSMVSKSDLWYYGVLDGLLFISGVFIIVIKYGIHN
jgi:hypothetical protein